MISTRIGMLREIMKNAGVDAYVIPTSDFHQSEYTGEYFNARQFLSGFTGSAGTLVITQQDAALFTDGRYFIQAEKQLAGTGIELMKMGVAGYPHLDEYTDSKIPEKGCLAFDGRTVDAHWGIKLQESLAKKHAGIKFEADYAGMIWEGRPRLPQNPVYLLDVKYTGETASRKLSRIREKMQQAYADMHLVATLDDICWLFNIRGNDIRHNPVVLAFAVITMEEALIFADKGKFSQQILEILAEDGIYVRPYEKVYEYISYAEDKKILIDRARINYMLYRSIPDSAVKIEAQNPSLLMKAVKNPTETDNLRSAHLKDGIAVTRFIYWLKKKMESENKADEEPVTELSAAEYLLKCRQEQDGFLGPSFDTISAYGPNAAMMHYSATPESDTLLRREGMLLVDSGGQYYEGTTDITRTIALGIVTPQMKKDFTLVLKGMLNLANARFLHGCTGLNLDILARGPLWEEYTDYRCGTGHGIGYLLNVHEAPNSIRWRHIPERNDMCVLEEGMVTSDEPGVYIEDGYGIRIENEIVCRKSGHNEYGQFMEFETLTLAPIDLDLVDTGYLEKKDIERLNSYHAIVFEKLAPFMQSDELEWLRYNTRKI